MYFFLHILGPSALYGGLVLEIAAINNLGIP